MGVDLVKFMQEAFRFGELKKLRSILPSVPQRVGPFAVCFCLARYDTYVCRVLKYAREIGETTAGWGEKKKNWRINAEIPGQIGL